MSGESKRNFRLKILLEEFYECRAEHDKYSRACRTRLPLVSRDGFSICDEAVEIRNMCWSIALAIDKINAPEESK